MSFTLTPLNGEPELDDPAASGEWAGALSGLPAMQLPWCFYFARDADGPVGAAGFKGAPDDDRRVEVAYLTFMNRRGEGVATRITAQLVELARQHRARGVRAHTLREDNPSTAVLRANGFAGPVDAIDPDDGPVWQWEKAL